MQHRFGPAALPVAWRQPTWWRMLSRHHKTWPGWNSSTRDARRWEQLPLIAQRDLQRLSQLAGVPIRLISVGPERERLIVLEDDVRRASA